MEDGDRPNGNDKLWRQVVITSANEEPQAEAAARLSWLLCLTRNRQRQWHRQQDDTVAIIASQQLICLYKWQVLCCLVSISLCLTRRVKLRIHKTPRGRHGAIVVPA